jgi:hypothetical protein
MKDIKEIYKNPMFYYILVPALAVLWPAIIWGVYLPAARASLSEEMDQFAKAEQQIEELLAADPERLNATKAKQTAAGFDYATAVQQTAEFCSIPTASYKLSSGIITKTEGQKTQAANVSLKGIEVIKAARFLSTIQLRWSGLQCTRVALKKNKGLPDNWDVDMTFKYYY